MINQQCSVLTALLAVAIALCGCAEDTVDRAQEAEDCPSPRLICIRIENSTDLDFQSFQVDFKGQIESYGPLSAGAISEYRSVRSAFDYAFTQAFSDERQFMLRPIDFLGAQDLQPGIYTYSYTVDIFAEPIVGDDWQLDGDLWVRLVVDN